MTTSTTLTGKRILVTRARAQAGDLLTMLAALGAQAIALPTIEIAPMADPAQLDQAITGIGAYDWIIFTSVNGVSAFWGRLQALGRQPDGLAGVAVAAIGPATARSLAAHGVVPRFVPTEYIAEAIAAGIGAVEGKRILLPRAEIARETLAIQLRQRGAIVDEIASYRTLPAAPDSQALDELRRGVDAILFTSSSTVRNFVELVGHAEPTGQAAIACIGPITARTAVQLGLDVHVVASKYTIEGLVDALAAYFERRRRLPENVI